MKKSILFVFALVVLSTCAFGQGIRFDIGTPGSAGAVTTFGATGFPQILAAPNVTLNFCSYPANALPCTNFVPTFTSLSLSTTCPSNAQIVLQGSSTCQSTSDSLGNLGVYLATSGTYAYTLTSAGVSYGPYTVTLGGSSSGGGGGGTGGGVTGVTATAPVVSSGGLSPNLSMPKATASVDGFLSHLDWANFNNAGIPAGITYARTSLAWSQSLSTALTANTQGTVTLAPCPVGVDTTSGAGYMVYLNDASAEAVQVTGGSCTSGANSGTLIFTPFFSHTSYTIGSASSGIQETINNACGVSVNTWENVQCNVTVPASGPYVSSFTNNSINYYSIFGTIYMHTSQSTLTGDGVSLNCQERGPCLQVGDLVNSNDYNNNTVKGFSFRYPSSLTSPDANSAFAGVNITNTRAVGGFKIVTTATAHNFRPGDWVNIQFTDDSQYWGDALVVDCGTAGGAAACTGASTSFRIASALTIASQATPGIVALSYEAILDNAMASHFVDIQSDFVENIGTFNHFFDFWDDQNATIDHFNNNGVSLNQGATWTGSYIYSGGAGNLAAGHQLAPVISLLNSNITANSSNGITVYNSNGLYVEDTVIQASGLWDIYCGNVRGNFKSCDIKNKYGEGPASTSNPAGGGVTPWPGLGGAGLIAATSSIPATISGSSGFSGYLPTGGAGATPYTYYVIVNDTTVPSQSSPMPILKWASTGSDSIPVKWPRIANGADVITYDVIRMTTPVNLGDAYPSNGSCPGGAGGICGSVATGISQATACSGTLICTFTDSGSASTTAYTIKQGNYQGQLNFWPGSLVTEGGGVQVDFEQGGTLAGPVVGIGLGGNPLQVAKECTQFGQAGPGGYTSCLASVNSSNNGVKNQTATLMTDGPSNTSDNPLMKKGRLNFPQTPYTQFAPHHIITLQDSQPALTEATIGYRPPASVNDVYIGTDQPIGPQTSGQLSFGAPVSISNYIANTGDNVSFLERLTASLKTFNVNVLFNNPLATKSYNDITEIAAPANPASGTDRLYADSSAHTLKCLTSSGGSCLAAGGGGSGTVNAATQFSATYYSGAGSSTTVSGVAAPTTPNNVPEVLVSTPTGSAATAPTWAVPGVAGRSVSGTTDTIVSTDCTPNRIRYNGTAAVAVTLPTATSLGVSNCVFRVVNLTASTGGTVTVTPTTWTINGAASLALLIGQIATIYTDPSSATNWQADVTEQAISVSGGTTITRSATGATIGSPSTTPVLTTGTSVSLTAPTGTFVCTSTCTVTPPVPVAGYQFCVMNDDNVSTVITLAALGSSARYENTARTAYGTAGTGTFISGGAVKDMVCIVGRDATHYLTTTFTGTWVAN